MRNCFLFLMISVLIFCAFSLPSQAQNVSSDIQPKASESGSVNVGNKICPVLGEKIDENAPTTYEYQGKIYNFCCPMCIDEFKKDPEKYIKKIEEEKQKEQVEGKSGKTLKQEEHNHSH